MKLLSRRRAPVKIDAPSVSITLDGEPAQPYELPPNPRGDAKVLRHMEEMDAKRAECDRTSMPRALNRWVAERQRQSGLVRVRTFGRYVFNVYDRTFDGWRQQRWELVRLGGWTVNFDIWSGSDGPVS